MPPSNRRLLETIVTRDDRGTTPVTVERLAEAYDSDVATIRKQVRTLAECELVKPAPEAPKSDPSGYVPTITGRELLALDFDENSLLIIDPEEC